MLHPRGQDLGDEGEEVRAGEWVPGSEGSGRDMGVLCSLCSLL